MPAIHESFSTVRQAELIASFYDDRSSLVTDKSTIDSIQKLYKIHLLTQIVEK